MAQPRQPLCLFGKRANIIINLRKLDSEGCHRNSSAALSRHLHVSVSATVPFAKKENLKIFFFVLYKQSRANKKPLHFIFACVDIFKLD